MGFDSLKKEREEIYKERKIDKQITFGITVTGLLFIYIITTGLKGDFSDFIFSTPNWNLKHYPLLVYSEIATLLIGFLWWKGNEVNVPVITIKKKGKFFYYPSFRKYPVFKKLNYYIQKIPIINDIFFFLNFKGKENELQHLFYQAPKQTDELSRAKEIIFKKYLLQDVFKDDYENTVNLFRGKDFKEKEKTFKDLIAIVEGVFKEYSKGYSRLHINEKDLPSPFRVKNILESSVFDRKNGEIHFSTKQMIDTIDDFCERFESFIDSYSKYQTRINSLYSEELKDKEIKKKLMLYFRMVMFRRFLKLYMNIPSGWFVIRLEDYTAKAIVSSIDRETLVLIDNRNKGEMKGFPDDRLVRMFQLLYHYFFTKTTFAKQFKNMFEIMSPDMTAKEMEDFILKNKSELEQELTNTTYEKNDNEARTDTDTKTQKSKTKE